METQERFKYLREDMRMPATIGDKQYSIYALDSHTSKVHANRVIDGIVVPFITIIATPDKFCTLTLRGEKHYKVEKNGKIVYVSKELLK